MGHKDNRYIPLITLGIDSPPDSDDTDSITTSIKFHCNAYLYEYFFILDEDSEIKQPFHIQIISKNRFETSSACHRDVKRFASRLLKSIKNRKLEHLLKQFRKGYTLAREFKFRQDLQAGGQLFTMALRTIEIFSTDKA